MDKLSQFEALVKLCLDAAAEKYGKLPNVRILFNLKGRAAGMAGRDRTGQYYMRFNREAMALDWEHMVKETIPHEVAHIVAYAKPELGAKGHNVGWKRIAWALGCKGERCHTMQLTPANSRKRVRYVYKTDRGVEVLVGPQRHKRIQSMGKLAGYRLKATGELLDRHHYVAGGTMKMAA